MENMDFLSPNCPQPRFRARDLHALLDYTDGRRVVATTHGHLVNRLPRYWGTNSLMKMAVELWSGPYGHLTCPLVLPPDLMILKSVFCNARHSINWVADKSNVQYYINVLKLNQSRVTEKRCAQITSTNSEIDRK